MHRLLGCDVGLGLRFSHRLGFFRPLAASKSMSSSKIKGGGGGVLFTVCPSVWIG